MAAHELLINYGEFSRYHLHVPLRILYRVNLTCGEKGYRGKGSEGLSRVDSSLIFYVVLHQCFLEIFSHLKCNFGNIFKAIQPST